jgi:hypothetical protein
MIPITSVMRYVTERAGTQNNRAIPWHRAEMMINHHWKMERRNMELGVWPRPCFPDARIIVCESQIHGTKVLPRESA